MTRPVAPGQARALVLALLTGSLTALGVATFVPPPTTIGAATRPLLVTLSLVASATLPVLARVLAARLAPAPTLAPASWIATSLRATLVEGALCEAAVVLAAVARLVTGSPWPLVGALLPLLGLAVLLARTPTQAPTR